MIIYKFLDVWYYLQANGNGLWWAFIDFVCLASPLSYVGQHPDFAYRTYSSLIVIVLVPCLPLAKV